MKAPASAGAFSLRKRLIGTAVSRIGIMKKRYAGAVGLLVALTIATTACRGSKETAIAPKRGAFRDAPVIIVSIDTLRADHLPAYGYRGVETPNIDAFRRGA